LFSLSRPALNGCFARETAPFAYLLLHGPRSAAPGRRLLQRERLAVAGGPGRRRTARRPMSTPTTRLRARCRIRTSLEKCALARAEGLRRIHPAAEALPCI
jgi:hypothetical protein